MPNAVVTLFHSPNTRSTGALNLLEELGMPYQLQVLDLKAGEQRGAPYLADLWPQAGLAPPIGDPLRGPYLRWLVFYGSSFEPAMVDRALKREPGQASTMPYGDVDTTIGTLRQQLAQGPWILGARFTAADVLWGTALTWMTSFGLLPDDEPFRSYVGRWNQRPSVARVRAIDARLAGQ